MMFETSMFRENLFAMRQIYQAGDLERLFMLKVVLAL